MYKKILAIVGIVTLTFVSMALTTENDNTKIVSQDKAPISENVDAKKFKYLIEHKEGVILDVRTVDEVANGHIDGAINIDYYGKAFKAELAKLDKTKPVFVYCKSGGRSSKAMSIMVDMGFVEIYNLLGGYGNWPYK